MSALDDRFQYVELDLDPDPVAIIQDRQNVEAWLQSSAFVPVER